MKDTVKMPPQCCDTRYRELNGAQSYFCLGVWAFLCPHDFAIAFQPTGPFQPNLTALQRPPGCNISTVFMKAGNQIKERAGNVVPAIAKGDSHSISH